MNNSEEESSRRNAAGACDFKVTTPWGCASKTLSSSFVMIAGLINAV